MNTKTFTVYSDYANNLKDFGDHVPDFLFLRELVGHNNLSLETDGTFQIRDYVGFFQRGNTRLQVLPKLYFNNNAIGEKVEIDNSLDFIFRLLQYSGYHKYLKLAPQFVESSRFDLLEIFISIFIDEFIALFNKKIHHEYIPIEDNQCFVKGKIIFPETIRKNPIAQHLHYVRFDEYSINNPMNRIFKYLIVNLLSKTISGDNKKKLVTGLAYLQEVDLVNVTTADFDNIRFNRLNLDYEPVFKLAKLFFHNAQPGINEGGEKTFSFMVKANYLFENFVAKILLSFSDKEYTYCYHNPCKSLGTQNGNKVFYLEPDFTVSKDNKIVIIADTKFKYPFDKNGKVSISSGDLYQLVTYSLAYHCNNLFLIYPKYPNCPDKNNLLTEYILNSPYGEVYLRVIQIDIMNQELMIIKDDLLKEISLRNKHN